MTEDLSLLDECRQYGTSTWSDALDEIGIEGVVSGLQQRSGTGRFAAYALPVRQRTGPLGSARLEDFALSRMAERISDGQALVVDMGGAEISAMGGIGTRAIMLRKAAAVVIDGACRDIDDIRGTDLWVASRSVTPRSGKRRAAFVSIGESATISGISVSAGDLVVGDATGIVVVPSAEIERVVAIVRRLHHEDQKMEKSVDEGASVDDAMAAAKRS